MIDSVNRQVFMLDSDVDGLEQIGDILDEFDDVDAIHLISHGDDGKLKLGDEWFDWESASESAAELANWQDNLAEGADLLLYGCNLAESPDGERLIDLLSELCQCDVAASDNLTGHESLGGDWNLEYSVGTITTEIIVTDSAQQQWMSLLSTPANTATDFFVFENVDTNGGYSLGDLEAPGVAAAVTWSIDSGADAALFSVGGVDSDELVIDDGVLDFETQSSYEVIVTANDGSSDVYTATLTVHVGDEAEGFDTGEELANDTTSGDQETIGNELGSHQAIAVNSSGQRVAVWTESDGDGQGVFAQRYDSDGNEVGAAFQVNADSVGDQQFANVAIDDTGRFVVAFIGLDSDGTGAFLRRFNADGTAIDAQDLLINEGHEDHDPESVSIATNASGQIAVAFGTENSGIHSRHFDMTTPAPTGEITTDHIHIENGASHTSPSIDINDSGRIVVVWEHNGELYAERYDHGNSSPLSSKHDVNIANVFERDIVVGVQSNGDFVIAYRSDIGAFSGIWASRIQSNGTPYTFPTKVSTGLDGESPSISIGTDDSFVITYQDNDSDGTGIYARKYHANALSNGSAFLINETTNGDQEFGSVAALDADTFHVVWSGDGVGDSDGVFTRTYRLTSANPAPTGVTIDQSTIDEHIDTTTGVAVGTLSATDPSTGDSFVYTIQGGADADSFSINGDQLVLSDGILDFEGQDSYEVVVTVIDSAFNTFDETITVSVNDLNDAPTAITPDSFHLNENVDTTGGVVLGSLTTIDPDTGETFTYAIDGGDDAGHFSIGGASLDQLVFDDGVLDFETQDVYRVDVRVTDSDMSDFVESVILNVADVNEAPSLRLENVLTTIPEQTSSSSIKIADIIVDDDALGSNRLRLRARDADDFMIVNNRELHLKPGTELDYEGQNTLKVRVKLDDTSLPGSSSSILVKLKLTDVNEAVQAADDTFVIDFSDSQRITPGVLANDFDPEGAQLSVSLVTQPQFGSVTMLANGEFVYIANDSFVGTDTFVYAVNDGVNAASFATVKLVVPIPLPSESVEIQSEESSTEANIPEEVEAETTTEVTLNPPPRENTQAETAVAERHSLIVTADVSITGLTTTEAMLDFTENSEEQSTSRQANGSERGLQVARRETASTEESPFYGTELSEAAFGAFVSELNELRSDAVEDRIAGQAVVGSSLFVTTSLSVGYVIWLVRGGVLLSSLLSSLPAWHLVDPLPILGHLGGVDDEDDESLESLVRSSNSKSPQPAPS